MKNKLVIKINNEEELKCPSVGYILGVKDFCVCFGVSFTLEQIKKIRKENKDKKIFVSLNRVTFENELRDYKKILQELDTYNLDGIIVGDIAALTYNLKTNVILDQMHLNNNYLTIKHYLNNGVAGIVLTNDITLEDINYIKKENPDSILFKQVFGLAHLSTSKRKLVTNYLTHFKKEIKSNVYIINEKQEDDSYFIYEDDFGTHILTNKPINLLSYLNDLNVDYFVFDSLLVEDCNDAFEAFINEDISKNAIINKKYNATEGFINKKTIYKVKNNE